LTDLRFLSANLALPSAINDELVNTGLPSEYAVRPFPTAINSSD